MASKKQTVSIPSVVMSPVKVTRNYVKYQANSTIIPFALYVALEHVPENSRQRNVLVSVSVQ